MLFTIFNDYLFILSHWLEICGTENGFNLKLLKKNTTQFTNSKLFNTSTFCSNSGAIF